MRRLALGRSGVAVTTLGFGGGPIGNLYRAVDGETAAGAVSAAWRAGVRFFDTAPHYGLGLSEGRFVLDHAAKPAIAAGAMEPWAGALAELALMPNLTCKLSGLVTEARWDDWDAGGIRPYSEHVLGAFGPDRVMFGSDWPVRELAASYTEVRELADELLEGLSPSERDAVLGGTATRVYHLA